MARVLFISLVATIVGGAIVYGVMLYLERNPVQFDVRFRSASVTPIPALLPTSTPAPQSPAPSQPPPAAVVSPTATPAASHPTPVPTAAVAPSPAETPEQLTERRIVVNAFAQCNGRYSGWDLTHRAWGANSAIEEGRQTVADIRALVEQYCEGMFPALAATVTQTPLPPTPTPSPLPLPNVPTIPANTPIPITTAVPTTTVRPTATLVAATAASPSQRHIEEKRYMLQIINEEREKAGLNAVALGNNAAAQLHAEAALTGCFSSHWGLDGLKPYMRYSLAGGYQSNGENGSGLDYCIRASDGYSSPGSIESRIRKAMQGWMSSPGHRRNILNPRHKSVNVGVAWDRYNTAMYQHFEGGYVEYDTLPSIARGILSLSGKTKNGVRFDRNRDLGVQIYYDPPPHVLTAGQVARTYCYDNGLRIAALREPLTGGYRWTTHEFTTTHHPCPNPYDVPADEPPPRSHFEAHQAWEQAYNTSQLTQPQSITVPWITAGQWTASGNSFSVTADIGRILDRYGDGVYSLMLWGKIGDEQLMISQYSIFHGMNPPDTYSTAAR